MHGFSTVDGFIDVNECLAEMIKYVANEPSVGLFYVQQHTQNAVPNLIALKEKVGEKSRETTLHTEDLEDSITMVRSMKECGLPLADEMVKDIKKSLLIMSASQSRRGLIHNQKSGFQIGRSSSWGPAAFGHSAGGAHQDGESSGSYLSTVLKSAKQRAVGFRWSQLDSKQPRETEGEKLVSSHDPLASVAADSAVSTLPEREADELPLSSQIVDEQLDEATLIAGSSTSHDLSSVLENYDEFKADREAKLKEWLEEIENLNGCIEASDAKGTSS